MISVSDCLCSKDINYWKHIKDYILRVKVKFDYISVIYAHALTLDSGDNIPAYGMKIVLNNNSLMPSASKNMVSLPQSIYKKTTDGVEEHIQQQ